MGVRPVHDIPPRRGGNVDVESYVAKDVREYLRNGWDCALFEYEGKTAKQVINALRTYVKRNPRTCAGIKATQRGERVYLVREVQR